MNDSMTQTQWIVLASSPFVSAALIRGLMYFADGWGLIDHPGHRKVHGHPTALVGGLGMLLTLMGLQAAIGRLPFESWSLLAALLVITGIGVADDAHELSHRAKFVAQAVGAAIIVSGTTVWVNGLGDLFGLGNIELGKWAILVTIISVVGVMNAINMIDGLDGLAGSLCLVPILILATLAASNADSLTFELLLVAGALVGFLALNLRLPGRTRAMVFMGDTGGMILGMLIAWYSIKLGGGSNSTIKPITAVWILAVPLLDMGGVMLLRLSQRKSPFHADQQHLHHVLLRAGYSVNQVVGIMSALSLAYGGGAVLAESRGVPQVLMFMLFLVLWASYVMALKHPAAVQALAHRILPPQAARVGSISS
jgi:UDP-GlcNAc:undecaprenyl-phosphate GlcNAc-1-phosphate transferase